MKTQNSLMRLNKISLVRMVLKLQEELDYIKEHVAYECMDCGAQFEVAENNSCPSCHSGDIVGEIND